MSIVLIGGGARSGKSRHALKLARQYGARLAFIATAQAGDAEMCNRIARHREERGPVFATFEEPLCVAARIAAEDGRFDAVVVDCLTLWLNNVMRAGRAEEEIDQLIATAAAARSPVLLVTNETGCGIVPENALARQFRDLAGRMNQRAAEAADEVCWMVFGIPMKVK